jgi:membrane protein YdbS with pleckstrin-like domain
MNVAEWAWVIVGAIVVLAIVIMVIMMIPELVRYMKLKSM